MNTSPMHKQLTVTAVCHQCSAEILSTIWVLPHGNLKFVLEPHVCPKLTPPIVSGAPRPVLYRRVTKHHDGFGLNDRLEIQARGDRGADDRHSALAPEYVVYGEGGMIHAAIDFQDGPRGEPGSRGGITEATLVAVLIDRLLTHQGGRFACRQNALCITKLEEVLFWMKDRARERFERGVLGKNEP